MLKIETPNNEEQSTATFLLRTLFFCYYRMSARQQHSSHRILL